MKFIKKAIIELPRNLIFQIILVVIFMIPLIETIGQYISSGFMNTIHKIPIIFWPGTKLIIYLPMYIWIIMGTMAVSYVVGILYLLRKKTFGIAIVIGFIGISIIAYNLGTVANYFTGWRELEGMSAPNSINLSLFSLWYNPLWEEIVFRGIPLIILMLLKSRLSKKAYNFAMILYFLIPSIMFAVYHVPNHGPSRIVDTFITGLVFAYLALKYSLFASLTIHYFMDAAGFVLSITNNSSSPKNQIVWLTQNAPLLNNIYYISIFCLKISIPIIIIWNLIKLKKVKGNIDSFNL